MWRTFRYFPAVFGLLLLSCISQSLASGSIETPAAEVLAAALLNEPAPLQPESFRRHVNRVEAQAAEIRRGLDRDAPPDRVFATLNEHFFGKDGYVPTQDLSSPENISVAAVLSNRRGTCLGLAIVYLSLAARLGLTAHAVATPAHVFVRVKLPDRTHNVELLEGGHEITDDFYLRRHRIAQSSIDTGVFLRDLTSDQVIAHLMSNQAIALSRAGRLQEALTRYDRALKSAPLLAAAWYNRGIDLMTAGKLLEAVQSFDRSIELHPNDAEAHNNRGIARVRLGDTEGARSDFMRALELDPVLPGARENLKRVDEHKPQSSPRPHAQPNAQTAAPPANSAVDPHQVLLGVDPKHLIFESHWADQATNHPS